MAAFDSEIANEMLSPCVKICTLDTALGMCLGCGRTIAEISRWTTMSARDRTAVMAQLPARLAARRPPAQQTE